MKKIDVKDMSDVWFSIAVVASAAARINEFDNNPTIEEISETLKAIADDLDEMGFNEDYHEQLSEQAIIKTIKDFIPESSLEDDYRKDKTSVLKGLSELLEGCKEMFFERLEVVQISGNTEEDLTEDYNDMIACQQDLLDI